MHNLVLKWTALSPRMRRQNFSKNPPTMLPRLDFAKLQALRKHMMQALNQLVCPQSQIHGWTGLIMDPYTP
jgi:hypothetical protein